MLSFEMIVKKTQPELKKALTSELQRMGYKPKTKNGYIYAEGKLPVMLVAHLDTVHKTPVKTVCYSSNGRIVMSPEGIGGDDRAGVYMILQIIKKHKCHVVFCEDEEIGGIGAGKFAASGIKPDINYMIELDRRGDNDAVFYDCDNPDFTNFITGFGFYEEFGSFSDISTIAPELGVAAVNISAGYFNEHTQHEYVDMQAVRDNIKRVSKIITTKTEKFEYIEAYHSYGRYFSRYYDDYDYDYSWSAAANKKTNTSTKKNTSTTVLYEDLMLLTDTHYVKTADGEMLESDDRFLINENGTVYEYLHEFDVAVEMADYSAFNESNLPAKFLWEESMEFEVASKEYAQELEELMCG